MSEASIEKKRLPLHWKMAIGFAAGLVLAVPLLIIIALVIGAFFLFGGEASVDDGDVDITVGDWPIEVIGRG